VSVERPVLPLYYRVFKTLEQRIDTQQYKCGDRLPSEDELCREFKVSRITMREALGRLVESGLLVRRRGSGSYVGPPTIGRTFRSITLTGSLEDLFAQVERTQIRSSSLAERTPPPDVGEALGLAPGAPATVLRRIRVIGDEPFAFTINYLPVELGRRIREADLYGGPLLQLLERKLRLRFTHAEQTVEARLADEDVAQALGGKFGDAVLYVERRMFAGADHPVELVRSHYRADTYRYHIRFVRQRRRAFAWRPEAKSTTRRPS
jgi:GntR family transcriptional regulator